MIDVYLAAKLHHFSLIHGQALLAPPSIRIISTWHASPTVVEDDRDSAQACIDGWHKNRYEVRRADVLVAYGEAVDPLNGTLIETGIAFGRGIPIFLIGSFPWGTWSLLPNVTFAQNHEEAFARILKEYA